MSDLISRQDVFDALEESGYCYNYWIDIKNIIESIPSVDRPQKVIAQITFDEEKLREIAKEAVERFKEEYEVSDRPQEWIPCSERLPETSVYVLATTNKGIITTAIIREGKTHNERYWWHRRSEFLEGEIVAWMPLPEPYKAEGEESHE